METSQELVVKASDVKRVADILSKLSAPVGIRAFALLHIESKTLSNILNYLVYTTRTVCQYEIDRETKFIENVPEKTKGVNKLFPVILNIKNKKNIVIKTEQDVSKALTRNELSSILNTTVTPSSTSDKPDVVEPSVDKPVISTDSSNKYVSPVLINVLSKPTETSLKGMKLPKCLDLFLRETSLVTFSAYDFHNWSNGQLSLSKLKPFLYLRVKAGKLEKKPEGRYSINNLSVNTITSKTKSRLVLVTNDFAFFVNDTDKSCKTREISKELFAKIEALLEKELK